MYNAHRGIPPAPSNRLTELLEQVRQEFENQQSRAGEYEQNSKFASPEKHICCSQLRKAVSLSTALYLVMVAMQPHYLPTER